MDEIPIPDIDTNVGTRLAPAAGRILKEHQVASLQLRAIYGRSNAAPL